MWHRDHYIFPSEEIFRIEQFGVYRQSKRHRVFPFVGIGSPHTLPPSECVSLLRPKGEGNTLLRVRVWRDPIRTTGQKVWHPIYCILCSIPSVLGDMLYSTVYCTVDPCGFLHRDSSNGQMGLQFKDEQIEDGSFSVVAAKLLYL
jgi:hypothetical protein